MEMPILNCTASKVQDKWPKINNYLYFSEYGSGTERSSLTLCVQTVNSKTLANLFYSWKTPRSEFLLSLLEIARHGCPSYPSIEQALPPTPLPASAIVTACCQLPRGTGMGITCFHPSTKQTPTDSEAVVKLSTLENWEAQIKEQGSLR